MRWNTIRTRGADEPVQVARIFRHLGTLTHAARYTFSQMALVRHHDPEGVLKATALANARECLRIALEADPLETTEVTYLVTMGRMKDLDTREVTVYASATQVFTDDAEVTPEASPAIDQTTTPLPEGDPR